MGVADLGAGTFYAVLLGFVLLYPPLATLFTARFLEIEGTAAALLALRGAEPDLAPRLGAIALFALGVFAKEDCGPFVLVAAAAPVVRAARLRQHRGARRAGLLLAALAATGLAALA